MRKGCCCLGGMWASFWKTSNSEQLFVNLLTPHKVSNFTCIFFTSKSKMMLMLIFV